MQAMVCQEKVGWRKNARHLLIVSTDGPFHVAGDGLVGVLKFLPKSEILIFFFSSGESLKGMMGSVTWLATGSMRTPSNTTIPAFPTST